MIDVDVNVSRERSTFVSVVAWIFIVLSGFGVFISILQNILFGFMLSQEGFKDAMEQPQQQGMPEIAQFMFENFQLFLIIMLLLITLLFASSIGLLLRKNWARHIFIGYMFFSAVYMVAGTFLYFGMMNDMMQDFGGQNAPPDSFMDLFNAMRYTMMVFNIAMGLVFGWIGWKLMRPAIREEFAVSG